MHCIGDWWTPDYDPQTQTPTTPGCQKSSISPRVFPCIFSDFRQKRVKTTTVLPWIWTRNARNLTKSDISVISIWPRGGVSSPGAQNDGFSWFSAKSAKTGPDPKAGRPNPDFSVKIVKNHKNRQNRVWTPSRCLAGVQTSGQEGALSMVFAKFAKFAENRTRDRSPLARDGCRNQKCAEIRQFLHISGYSGTLPAILFGPQPNNQHKTVKSAQNREIGTKPRNRHRTAKSAQNR